MSFNRYYQSELTALRQLCRRFADRSPALAPFLGQAGRDPDVERLLEGFAFLTGRLRQKLDDELPELGWHIGLVLKVWFKVGVMVGEIWRNLLVRGGLSGALVEINLATIASYKDGGVSAVVYAGTDGSLTVKWSVRQMKPAKRRTLRTAAQIRSHSARQYVAASRTWAVATCLVGKIPRSVAAVELLTRDATVNHGLILR